MTQQEIERFFFEKFREAYPLPAGEITYSDKPDVLLHGAQQIGIEITNFFVADGASPASEQVQRKLRKAAVAEGQRLYQQDGGRNIELTFSFDSKHPIQNVKALARQLSVLGRHVDGGNNGRIRKDVFEHIPEIDFVYLYAHELQFDDEPDPKFPNGPPDLSESLAAWIDYRNRREARALQKGVYAPLQSLGRWKVSQGHSFGLMSTKRLTKIIEEKEAKAQHYTPCEAYWLLIIVNYLDAAQEQEIRIDGITIKSDVFQKIVVYKPGFQHIVEITPQPASAR